MPASTFTYEDLYAWAEEHLPCWQQDALRRVVAQGELEEAELDELVQIAEARRPEPSKTGSTQSAGPDLDRTSRSRARA
jgi:hypothetical protein